MTKTFMNARIVPGTSLVELTEEASVTVECILYTMCAFIMLPTKFYYITQTHIQMGRGHKCTTQEAGVCVCVQKQGLLFKGSCREGNLRVRFLKVAEKRSGMGGTINLGSFKGREGHPCSGSTRQLVPPMWNYE